MCDVPYDRDYQDLIAEAVYELNETAMRLRALDYEAAKDDEGNLLAEIHADDDRIFLWTSFEKGKVELSPLEAYRVAIALTSVANFIVQNQQEGK